MAYTTRKKSLVKKNAAKVAKTKAKNSSIQQKAGEGQYRSGPYWLPYTGGWLSAEAGSYLNWWQMGYDVEGVGQSALVEACVSAYAQTLAMCPGDHWKSTGNGGRERQKTNVSALARILRTPNEYETISDFLLNAGRELYTDGNAYGLALRNSRFEIDQVHLMRSRMCQPYVAETGDVFYKLGGNDVVDQMMDISGMLVPQRDVLHIRLNRSDSQTLVGESPVMAAVKDIAASNAIVAQQLNFYLNQTRPSSVLQTDLTLTPAQVAELRQMWNEQTKSLNSGGTPILTSGLKLAPMQTTPKDSELSEVFKLSRENIAMAFRIPLQILGIGGTQFSTTEALMQYWIASGLGFALNHIEEAFGRLFGLRGQPEEYVEFNTAALMRSAMKDRVEAMARGVQGGIFSPNEARETFELPAAKFGDEPRVQQQVVPLSAAGQIAPAPGPAAPPSASPVKPTKVSDDATIQRAARRLIVDADRLSSRRRLSA